MIRNLAPVARDPQEDRQDPQVPQPGPSSPAGKTLRMSLILRRAITRRPRVRIAHICALCSVPVIAAPVRAHDIVVVDMREAIDPHYRVGGAAGVSLLF